MPYPASPNLMQIRHRIEVDARRLGAGVGIAVQALERQQAVRLTKADVMRNPIGVEAGAVDEGAGLEALGGQPGCGYPPDGRDTDDCTAG